MIVQFPSKGKMGGSTSVSLWDYPDSQLPLKALPRRILALCRQIFISEGHRYGTEFRNLIRLMTIPMTKTLMRSR